MLCEQFQINKRVSVRLVSVTHGFVRKLCKSHPSHQQQLPGPMAEMWQCECLQVALPAQPLFP